ncbi:MAG: hypothetical protein ACYTF6_00765 [Planctomycetota bacterium]|jgi:hypothetical protein
MKQLETTRSLNFTLTTMGLIVIGVALTAMFIVTTRDALNSSGETRRYLSRLAWLSAALLALCLLMLVWVLARRAKHRISRRKTRSQTPYVDAWAEAGKRLKLRDADKQQDNEENASQ